MSVPPIRVRVAAWTAALGLYLAAGLAASPIAGGQEVHAQFVSGAGEAGVQSVQMFVDGRDVSAGATASGLRVAYTPSEKLSPGTHSARVIVVDSLGRSFVKEWSFEVAADSPRPDVIAFFSEALAIELDPLARQVRGAALRLSGTTQPGAEVAIRLDGDLASRVMADGTGRFVATVDLATGENDLRLAATRLDTGEDGPEIARRVERVAPPTASILPLPRPALGVGASRPATGSVGRPAVDPLVPVIVPPDPPVSRGRPHDEAVASRESVPHLDPIAFDPPELVVVITKPDDGDRLNSDHVTVLGRAPARWRVTLRVDGQEAGSDTANPAGHFTIPNVEIGAGLHELIAEAEGPDGTLVQSRPVRVHGLDALVPQQVAILLPSRPSTVLRGRTLRVEGVAWDGAEVDIEVNGDVVATEIAAVSGRFAVDVPVEAGSNIVAIETHDRDGSRWTRSRTFFVTAQGSRQGPILAPAPVARRGVDPRRVPARGQLEPRGTP